VAINVLLCDDDAEVRLLLNTELSLEPGIEIVGEACNGRSAVDLCSSLRPDVAILDLAMPVMDGREALPQILEGSPDTSVVVLSGFDTCGSSSDLLELGATACLEKGVEMGEIVRVIRATTNPEAGHAVQSSTG
jgi:DNA-binding NarL/FixJ family response regulator